MSLRSIGLNEWLKFKKFVSQDGMGTTGKDKEIINHIGKALVYLLPLLKDLFNFVVVEAVIIPRIVCQQLMALGILRGSLVMVGVFHNGWMWIKNRLTSHGRKGRKLRRAMKDAETFDEWKMCAEELDRHEHEHLWRHEEGCDLYDEQGLLKRTDLIQRLIEKGDIPNLIFKLRGGLSRAQYGIMHEGLFRHARSGTKIHIEEYLRTIVTALCTICEDSSNTSNSSAHSADSPYEKDTAKQTPSSKHHSTQAPFLQSSLAEMWKYNDKLSFDAALQRRKKAKTTGSEEIPQVSTDTKLAFFNEMRHAYGRTALMLSGGASLGYYHIGLVGALLDQGLLPRVISGSSAGSVMAATIGTKTDEELRFMVKTGKGFRLDFGKPVDSTLKCPVFRWFCGDRNKRGIYRKASFWKSKEELELEREARDSDDIDYETETHDEGLYPPVIGMLFSGFWRYPFQPAKGLLCDTDQLALVIRENCGDYTFQEAFEKTGRIINITVAPHNHADPPRLLNYLTAPHILVRSASLASCAVPGVFEPQQLLVKDMHGNVKPIGVHHSDGSLENDLPSDQLSELFNINHFIVSQVNPHGVLLSTLNANVGVVDSSDFRRSDFSLIHIGVSAIMGFLQSQIRAWGQGLIHLLSSGQGAASWHFHRQYLKGLAAAVIQDYSGRPHDVNILPWNHHLSLLGSAGHMLDSASKPQYYEIIKVSQKNTFPKLPRILAHGVVEACLERCVQRLRHRLSEELKLEVQESLNNNAAGKTILRPEEDGWIEKPEGGSGDSKKDENENDIEKEFNDCNKSEANNEEEMDEKESFNSGVVLKMRRNESKESLILSSAGDFEI